MLIINERAYIIYTRKKGNKSRHFLLLVHTIFVPLHNGKKSGQKSKLQKQAFKTWHQHTIRQEREKSKAGLRWFAAVCFPEKRKNSSAD